jgi:hypothetical protein
VNFTPEHVSRVCVVVEDGNDASASGGIGGGERAISADDGLLVKLTEVTVTFTRRV